MNENSSLHTSTSTSHHGLTAEAISRRAYELWEKEGRPESRDLHHWLRAEQELLAEQRTHSTAPSSTLPGTQRSANTDTPLQGTRTATAASRDTRGTAKRSSPPPGGMRAGNPGR